MASPPPLPVMPPDLGAAPAFLDRTQSAPADGSGIQYQDGPFGVPPRTMLMDSPMMQFQAGGNGQLQQGPAGMIPSMSQLQHGPGPAPPVSTQQEIARLLNKIDTLRARVADRDKQIEAADIWGAQLQKRLEVMDAKALSGKRLSYVICLIMCHAIVFIMVVFIDKIPGG